MHYFLGFELHHQSTTPYSLSTRMAPKGWTTDAQAEFLASYLPLYDTYAVRKRYQPFWDTINASYLRKFPILADGVSAESLNEEDRRSYTEELNKLYTVCQVPN